MESRRSLTQAVGDVVSDSLDLIQTELRLARAEASEKLGSALTLLAKGGAGAIFLLLGSILLMLGAVRWLAIAGLPEEWGLLLIGGIAAAAGEAVNEEPGLVVVVVAAGAIALWLLSLAVRNLRKRPG